MSESTILAAVLGGNVSDQERSVIVAANERIVALEKELPQLESELRRSQSESSTLRRHYLHEKGLKEAAEAKLATATLCPLCRGSIDAIGYQQETTFVVFKCLGCQMQLVSDCTRERWLRYPEVAALAQIEHPQITPANFPAEKTLTVAMEALLAHEVYCNASDIDKGWAYNHFAHLKYKALREAQQPQPTPTEQA
jgi:hypothetical protein